MPRKVKQPGDVRIRRACIRVHDSTLIDSFTKRLAELVPGIEFIEHSRIRGGDLVVCNLLFPWYIEEPYTAHPDLMLSQMDKRVRIIQKALQNVDIVPVVEVYEYDVILQNLLDSEGMLPRDLITLQKQRALVYLQGYMNRLIELFQRIWK